MLLNTALGGVSNLRCGHSSAEESSRTTSTGLTSARVLSLAVVCLSQSAPPSPHIHVPRMTDHPVRPSVDCPSSIATCHLSLSPLCPYVSLSHGPPEHRCVGPVHLADGHSVTQWEAILPQCEAIVVANIMDREVKRRY